MEFLKARATGRGLAVAAGAAVVFGLISRLFLVPAYHGISGFTPFDVQFPLSPFMIAVERGGYAEGSAVAAYVLFAAVDLLYMVATAWLFILGWVWLFSKVPTRLFAFLTRGGILMLPTYIVFLDIATKVGFFRLVCGLTGPSFAATVEFCATIHRLKFALIDIRLYLTAAFLLVVVLGLVIRQRPPRRSSGSAFPS